MEKRVLLAIVLCIIVLVLWEKFFVPKRQPVPPSTSPAVEQPPTAPTKPDQPESPVPETPTSEAPAPTTPSFPTPAAHTARDITVETPLYRAVFTETGARLRSFVLKNYRETIEEDSPGKELVKTKKIEHLPLAFNFVDRPVAALNLAPYVADSKTSVTISEGQNHTLTFSYEAPGWLRITRQYHFTPDSYLIDLTVSVENLGSQPWENAPTLGLISQPISAGTGSRYTFQGPALLANNELEEVKFKKIEGEKKFPGPIDWVAYTGQFFIMALLPVELTPNHAQLEALDAATQMVEITLLGPKIALQPGVQQKFAYKLFLGPKEVNTLKAADPRLAKAVNFGWFDVIAQPLLVCLKFFYRYLHNYGVAIILLTVLIKILFWPLTHKSYVSMKAMKKLQPKMQKIREKYKDDKEKMNQEIMQMYRTHKVNPVGGCFPMLLQIPVFFALYRLLYSSIAMRHAPFLWWINDLSAPDRFPIGVQIPYLGDGLPILTVLMGVSMYVQQKMSPTGGDPKMEKMMMMMPVVFTVFFVNFPSGLVLYWLVNNILSVGQQYYINKKVA
ncbi:MAG: membrane protein insertase YidC [Deltaproteobacteria bacterium]|jgi:YidC/Oxa1 family membrane protein insertase|nr:membrane protein insertase YidC [Deltaproteobacteria bacterium]